MLRLDSSELHEHEIINQVENKVILIKIPASRITELQWDISSVLRIADNEETDGVNGHLLVAVDQHAAHERILLEGLEKDWSNALHRNDVSTFCGFDIRNTLGDVMFKISLKNPNAYRTRAAQFGIKYSAMTTGTSDEYAVCILSIPHFLVSNGSILKGAYRASVDILRCLMDESKPLCQKMPALKDIVQPFLQLRACRTAIRFGDPLTRQEMERLVAQLFTCRLPFNCAHGRPTCVPIAMLP